MKLKTFSLADNLGRETPVNLVSFMYRMVHETAEEKRAVSNAEADEYLSKINQEMLNGFTNGERFFAVGVYALRTFVEDGSKTSKTSKTKQTVASTAYVMHAFVGRTRLSAISHLQCGVRKNWGGNYEIEPIIERTMSLVNAMQIGAKTHEARLQGALGQGREEGGVEGAPAESEFDLVRFRTGYLSEFIDGKNTGL